MQKQKTKNKKNKSKWCTYCILEGCHQVLINNFRGSAALSLISLHCVKAEGRGFGQVSGGGGWRPWGDRACVSHMIHGALSLHTQTSTDRQTKADWKQRLAVYYSCRGMSVRNSPLICFILFYEAVNTKLCVRCISRVVSQSPPSGSPICLLL